MEFDNRCEDGSDKPDRTDGAQILEEHTILQKPGPLSGRGEVHPPPANSVSPKYRQTAVSENDYLSDMDPHQLCFESKFGECDDIWDDPDEYPLSGDEESSDSTSSSSEEEEEDAKKKKSSEVNSNAGEVVNSCSSSSSSSSNCEDVVEESGEPNEPNCDVTSCMLTDGHSGSKSLWTTEGYSAGSPSDTDGYSAGDLSVEGYSADVNVLEDSGFKSLWTTEGYSAGSPSDTEGYSAGDLNVEGYSADRQRSQCGAVE